MRSSASFDYKRVQILVIVAWSLQVLITCVAAFLAGASGFFSLRMISLQSFVGIFFWMTTWISLRFQHRADIEALDQEASNQQRLGQGLQTIFEHDEGLAQRNLTQWTRYILPAVSAALSFLLVLPLVIMTFWSDGGLPGYLSVPENGYDRILLCLGLMGTIGFVGFLMGVYLSGLSRLFGLSGLRASTGYLMSTLVSIGLALVAMVLAYKWTWQPDRWVGFVILLWMTIQGFEIFVQLILGFYRPRVQGVEERVALDSRLSGMLVEPQRLFQAFSHTLDYQFGFQISQTWFFRFFQKALFPLFLIQVITFYLMTCFFVIRPGERAIVERMGLPRGTKHFSRDIRTWENLPTPVMPGMRIKWPWPFEKVRRVDVARIEDMDFGYEAGDEGEHDSKADHSHEKIATWDENESHVSGEKDYILPLSWDDPDYQGDHEITDKPREEEHVFDGMLLRGVLSVEFRVGDDVDNVYRYLYAHRDPHQVLRAMVERQLSQYFAGADFWDLLVSPSQDAGDVLKTELQDAADRIFLGLDIVAVNIQELHPPSGEVGQAYQKVLASAEEEKALIYGGEVEANQIFGQTPADVNETLKQAESYYHRHIAIAGAEADRFTAQHQAFEASPKVYQNRILMRTYEDGMPFVRKFIVPKDIEVRIDYSQFVDPFDDFLTEEIKRK